MLLMTWFHACVSGSCRKWWNCMLIYVFIVIFEFPWQFGYGAFALYLVGIAQTLADVSDCSAILSDFLAHNRLIGRAIKLFHRAGYHHQGLWISLAWLSSLHLSFVTTLLLWLVARWHAPTCMHPKCVCDCCMYFGLSTAFHLPWQCSFLVFAWFASLIIIWPNSSLPVHAMHLSKQVSSR